MKILCMGSLNLDYTYKVPHFVSAGETISSADRETHCGGKGLNQSIALARAGAMVFHAGHIGSEGLALKEQLAKSGVDVSLVKQLEMPTGHAVIQVNPEGQNCIIIFGGANQAISREDVDEYLGGFEAGDILLVQNETSCVEYAIEKAAEKGMLVALNPSPINDTLKHSPALGYVRWFILNELEGYELSGKREPLEICREIKARYPESIIVLTLGSEGCMYYDGEKTLRHRAYTVNVVDTTGAGDTFTGYFLSMTAAGESAEAAIETASKASAMAVGIPGAAASIPRLEDVKKALLPLSRST